MPINMVSISTTQKEQNEKVPTQEWKLKKKDKARPCKKMAWQHTSI